ncbi:hypothetical protein EVAR_66048_1 [Eumeta japonica]|uniref:Uncharacterized protein n=1 Tax=Eumeta variegata TaxID=151549 RepID=A0A4C2AER4_EUMVA|nr:hypothetical protein EVAR_66048_1 [Eumeta japonica]
MRCWVEALHSYFNRPLSVPPNLVRDHRGAMIYAARGGSILPSGWALFLGTLFAMDDEIRLRAFLTERSHNALLKEFKVYLLRLSGLARLPSQNFRLRNGR